MLVGLQFLVASAAVASVRFREVVKSTPRALLREGRIDEAAIRDERVSREEVSAAIRGAGIGALDAVALVVLETDGSFSVIPRKEAGDGSALREVRGAGPERERD